MLETSNKTYVVLLGMVFLLAAFIAPCVAAEPGSSDQAADSASQISEPKKTEYDKLPLGELVRRAKTDDALAQFELGSRFNYGRSAPKNVKEALRWLRQAAQNGQQDAQRLLVLKFYHGYEVPADHGEAFRWTQMLADEGDVPAQLTLANMYANGDGVARNLVRSYMWYDIAAAAAGKEDAPESVEKAARAAVGQREKVIKLLLPEQEVEAQQLASQWWLQREGISLDDKKATGSSSSSRKH